MTTKESAATLRKMLAKTVGRGVKSTVGLGCYAVWNLCTYIPYASDSSLDSPDQCKHFGTSLAPSNRLVVALEGVQLPAI